MTSFRRFHASRRGAAVLAGAALVSSLIVFGAGPVSAQAFTADGTFVVPGPIGATVTLDVTAIGGGGGASYSPGGNAAVVTTKIRAIAGHTLTVVIGRGGTGTLDGFGGAAGGGSSAILDGGTLLVEAGGGGGQGYSDRGGDAGGANGAGGDGGPIYGSCLDIGSGGGGNTDGAGAGGAGGIMGGICPSTNGMAGAAASAGGAGGAGGGVGTVIAAGGAGHSPGGAGGAIDAIVPVAGGGGGGGGFGGGGGGAYDTGSAIAGGGGGGGSTVNPSFVVGTPTYAPASSGPGATADPNVGEHDGHDGTVSIQSTGPAVLTEASAATLATTSATVHSLVNDSGATATVTIDYGTSATLATVLGQATLSPGTATGGGDTAVSGTISGLTAGTTYYYRATAVNADGTTVGAIASFLIPSAPGAPSNVAATSGDGTATVSWDAPSNGGSSITNYTVTASPGGASCTVAAPATSCVVSGLTNGTAYTFSVIAANSVGAGPASVASAAATATPAAPVTTTTSTTASAPTTTTAVPVTTPDASAPIGSSGSAPDQLAVTGSSTVRFVGLAVLGLLAGAVALVVRRARVRVPVRATRH